MQPFTTLTGVAAPLPLANVDTDKIIPARFLKTIKRTGWARICSTRCDSTRRALSGRSSC